MKVWRNHCPLAHDKEPCDLLETGRGYAQGRCANGGLEANPVFDPNAPEKTADENTQVL